MFAPKLAKPQTKLAERPASWLALQQPVSWPAAKAIGGDFESKLAPEDIPVSRCAAWDFNKVSLLPAGYQSRSQARSSPSVPPLPGIIQPKVAIGHLDDPLEHEADRVAEQVVRMADPELSIAQGPTGLSRKCAACEEEEHEQVQTKRAGAPSSDIKTPNVVHDVLRSPGKPLDTDTRAFFETRFRFDFGKVRIYDGGQATIAAKSMGARAFAVGSQVVFDENQFAPRTTYGRQLLAHELTHVVQQSGGVQPFRAFPRNVPKNRSVQSLGELSANPTLESLIAVSRNVGVRIQQQGHPPRSGTSKHSKATYFHCRTPSDHKHRPTHDWSARQNVWGRQCDVAAKQAERGLERLLKGRSPNINERAIVECVCAHSDPRSALEWARHGTMVPGGLASKHIDYYLSGGGADFVEDLRNVLLTDDGVRKKLAAAMHRAPRGCVSIEQSDFSSHDFRYAFGAIDRMDYEVDGTSGMAHVWFRDRYEWHPEDTSRPSNCVHRAAVELKDSGAADYWMVGDATVPLSWFTSGPSLWERIFD